MSFNQIPAIIRVFCFLFFLGGEVEQAYSQLTVECFLLWSLQPCWWTKKNKETAAILVNQDNRQRIELHFYEIIIIWFVLLNWYTR